MLTSPANCGKTFLLNSLNNIFNTFTNPASTSFTWVGAEKAEVVFLNDFRWSPQIIAWHDLLLMLEGQLVHLPAPKCHFANNIVFNSDTTEYYTEGSLHLFSYDFCIMGLLLKRALKSGGHPPEKFKIAAKFRAF